MGSVGDTAKLSKQRLATYSEARAFLDRRFNTLRFRGYLRREGKPCQQYWWVKTVNDQWAIAARALANALLPQREGRGKYDRVRTVHPGKKVKLKDSTKLKRLVHKRDSRKGRTGLLRKNRKRKQKPGAIKRRRGRPAYTPEQRKYYAALSAKKKARRRRLKHFPKRAYPEDRKRKDQPVSRVSKKRRIDQNIQEARKFVNQHHKDTRKNHDVRYAYLSPKHRIRATNGNSHKKRSRKRAGRKAGNPRASLVLIARRIYVAVRLKKRLAEYWGKVRNQAERHPK